MSVSVSDVIPPLSQLMAGTWDFHPDGTAQAVDVLKFCQKIHPHSKWVKSNHLPQIRGEHLKTKMGKPWLV